MIYARRWFSVNGCPISDTITVFLPPFSLILNFIDMMQSVPQVE